MIETFKQETYSDIKNDLESISKDKNASSLDLLKENQETIEKKVETPINDEIIKIYSVGTLDERLSLDYSLLEQGMGGKTAPLAKFKQLEESDKEIEWDSNSKKPELVWKQIQVDKRTALEKLFKRPARMENTDEVVVYVNMHNGDKPENNTVLVTTTSFKKDGVLELQSIKSNHNSIFTITNQEDVDKAYQSDNNLNEAHTAFVKGVPAEQYRQMYRKENHVTLEEYWKKKDVEIKKERVLDPREWERKTIEKELHDRLDNLGEKYKNLLETNIGLQKEIIELTNKKVSQEEEKTKATKNKVRDLFGGLAEDSEANNGKIDLESLKKEILTSVGDIGRLWQIVSRLGSSPEEIEVREAFKKIMNEVINNTDKKDRKA